MEKRIEDKLPIMSVEQDCILSKMGDITIGFKLELPEIFTLSENDYEAFHQSWIKAIRVLPKHSVLHKQDWFLEDEWKAEFEEGNGREETAFLSRSSDRFFNERPFLNHSCYLYLTKKPKGRKASSSLFSSLLRSRFVPEQTIDEKAVRDFIGTAGQFRRIMEDSGFVKMTRLRDADLVSTRLKKGLIESYCMMEPADAKPIKGDI
jgi:hypothetical protein